MINFKKILILINSTSYLFKPKQNYQFMTSIDYAQKESRSTAKRNKTRNSKLFVISYFDCNLENVKIEEPVLEIVIIIIRKKIIFY